MKQMDVDCKVDGIKKTPSMSCPPPPPPPLPPPPLPRSWATIKPFAKRSSSVQSVTKQEIAKYWRQKRMEEEDHLLSAIKAAARIRARNLTEEDYKRFEESLNDDTTDAKKKDEDNTTTTTTTTNVEKELRVGIKDWWTKSKYAYLNQPAIESMEKPKRSSTYIPNFCFYKSPSSPHPTSLGVF
ncbi:uncharacterized protein LOC122658567 [Telopea speciosissima]|uniref:uncharacterized protein LOC122658567 n=1 Tax=Telopea speciosissima TaxID=54955 RepID=UPI001CC537FD|nr:uncharacterized protein LOC122658567 [Telopea speciosissima]